MSSKVLAGILSVCLFDRFKKKPPENKKIVLHALYLDVGPKKELLMESTTPDKGVYIRFINNKEEFAKKVEPLVEEYNLDGVLIKDLVILDIVGGIYKISVINENDFLIERMCYLENGEKEEVRQAFLNSPTDIPKL